MPTLTAIKPSWRWAPGSVAELLRLLFGFAGDDLVLDLVVGGYGKDTAGGELVLGGVGPAGDDTGGIGVTDAVEGLELVGGRGVDVELVGGGGRRGGRSLGCRLGGGFRGGFGLSEGKSRDRD